jgi:hypothetical protein
VTDERWDEWADHVRTEVVPMIDGSAICIAISPPNAADLDIKFCVELGAMICLDKPVILVVPFGRQANIPKKLRDVADAIITGAPGDPGFADRLEAALKDIHP